MKFQNLSLYSIYGYYEIFWKPLAFSSKIFDIILLVLFKFFSYIDKISIQLDNKSIIVCQAINQKSKETIESPNFWLEK